MSASLQGNDVNSFDVDVWNLLAEPQQYDGQLVTVFGRFFASGEAYWLAETEDDCKAGRGIAIDEAHGCLPGAYGGGSYMHYAVAWITGRYSGGTITSVTAFRVVSMDGRFESRAHFD